MSLEVTPQVESEGGKGQDLVRDKWRKLVECQERVKFWNKMLEWGVGVREIEHLCEDIRRKFRSELMQKGGCEREVIMSVMKLKLKDERRHERELKRDKEKCREDLRKEINCKKKFERIMSKISAKIKRVRKSEKARYRTKSDHLIKIRQEKEVRELEECPIEIEKYKNARIFNKKEWEKMKKEEVKVTVIGKVKLDKDEEALLSLPPKFAIRRRLDSLTMQTEIEMGMAKTRYQVAREEGIIQQELDDENDEKTSKKQRIRLTEEEMEELEADEILEAECRRVYDPINRIFDHTKKRATDLAENNKVTLPKPCSNFIESGIEMIRSRVLETFTKYRKRECNDRGEQVTNLTAQERRGMRKK